MSAAVGLARVSGLCVDCHTMHNSQNGESVVFKYDTITKGIVSGVDEVNPGLLNTDCVGCHQGTNSPGSVPFVLDINATDGTYGTTGTEGTTLAGGNFFWVAGNERAGHNVAGIVGSDLTLTTAPGGDMAVQVTCAGINGCHGDTGSDGQVQSLLGSHHKNDSSVWKTGVLATPTDMSASYRFLAGVKGMEDTGYELNPSKSKHNRYYGVDRNISGDAATGSISSLCARCHGDFHSGAGVGADGFTTSVWLRHPVDYDMSRASSSSEYATYNGDNSYSVISPVAGSADGMDDTLYNQTGDAIVMCLSCHRAHGSRFDSSLRWNYKKWPALDGYNGCAVCHTSKN
ncbi:MAG: hypothetical protein OEY01_00025 [Desulfobulbaceae bacterium]|nr:hypothetical protein [Desulfobulbaceae bacterium]HIJ77680.1 hypothetical protein [Deltaproteobacteria bacterium]